MADEVMPVLRIWKLYNEVAKELIKNPLDLAKKAFEEARQKNDLDQIELATDLLSFITKERLSDK